MKHSSWIVCGVLAIAATGHAQNQSVATRMRNLNFHLGYGVELRVDDLNGRLVSRKSGPPTFDDLASYKLEIDSAQVAMTPESLSNLLNNYVFAYSGAPLSKLKVEIEGSELKQTGVLKKGIPVPFTMRATIAATPDGKIRLHPTKMTAAGVLPKRVLDFFGVELENLVKVKAGVGVAVDGDDLLLDPERLFPPPSIGGRVTKAWIENGMVMEQFGGDQKPTIAPPDRRFTNYMYYRGGTLRFGKLTMRDTDLLLVDANQKDLFDFSPERYDDQLVAGYSKNTRAKGLIVYMPDLHSLGAAGNRAVGNRPTGNERAEKKPAERQHHK